ncbi:hypothetical protein PanWU01x14_186910 [Parasponia andersonii]|uniref:Uncharacterized protein n=1 Tax=Parasponia andersonii TaxID=3476 RepID=A0A2P5C3I4_PARAD|nr:hypothetical protein PanWU01x14_186910 [Parasponia andersonii]
MKGDCSKRACRHCNVWKAPLTCWNDNCARLWGSQLGTVIDFDSEWVNLRLNLLVEGFECHFQKLTMMYQSLFNTNVSLNSVVDLLDIRSMNAQMMNSSMLMWRKERRMKKKKKPQRSDSETSSSKSSASEDNLSGVSMFDEDAINMRLKREQQLFEWSLVTGSQSNQNFSPVQQRSKLVGKIQGEKSKKSDRKVVPDKDIEDAQHANSRTYKTTHVVDGDGDVSINQLIEKVAGQSRVTSPKQV